tara:strand:+ start:460 stop:630 length:171 start_codon:yes stop_codon:yes gene_type:complete
MTYKLIKNALTSVVDQVEYTTEETNMVKIIPFDPDNTDYKLYLEWVEKGNTPEAAD